MSVKERAGIMGGTFDPITIGHLLQISELVNYRLEGADTAYFKKIIVVPCGDGRTDKKPRLDGKTRMSLCELSIEEWFGGRMIEEVLLDGSEIEGKGFLPTWELWKVLKTKYPQYEMTFIIAEDLLDKVHSWYNGNAVISTIPFFVLPRKGYEDKSSLVEIPRHIQRPETNSQFQLMSSSISSTEVRKRIATRSYQSIHELHQALRGLVTPKVIGEICDSLASRH